jgi:hypothetical protein
MFHIPQRLDFLLPRQRRPPGPSLPHLPQIPQYLLALRQLPRHLLRHGLHPARHRRQLRPLDDRGVHFPIRRAAAPLFVVDKVQLRVIRCAGFGGCCEHRVDLFHVAASEERLDWLNEYSDLVGEYCLSEYGRLGEFVVEGCARGEDVWAFDLVIHATRWSVAAFLVLLHD